MKARAKALRSRSTEAEQRLWYRLRAHRFLDLKFKRQIPIGPYIVDFICTDQALVIEVDGGQHNASRSDARRDEFLRSHGLRVLRFWNDEVLRETEAVLEAIRLALAEPAARPSPAVGLTRTGIESVLALANGPLPQAGEGHAGK